MNVIFHTITGSAIATVISSRKPTKFSQFKVLFVGFLFGVFAHGLLDFLPHQYPFVAKVDILISSLMIALVLLFVKKSKRLVFASCLFGSVFPDLVDLGPALLNQYLGMGLPVFKFKVFPWHWPEYSGSIFDDSDTLLSHVMHFVVLLVSFVLLFLFGKRK